MTRSSRFIFPKLRESIRKLLDTWSSLQTNEDERWRKSIGKRPASREGLVDGSECDTTTEAPSILAGDEERPLAVTRAPGEGRIESENQSAAGPVPTLFELIEKRQSEYKPPAAKNLLKGDAD